MITLDELVEAVGKKIDYHADSVKVKGILSDIHISRGSVKIVVKSADTISQCVVDFGDEDCFLKVLEFVPAEKDKTGQESQ